MLGLIFLGFRIRSGKTHVFSVLESYLEKMPVLSTVYLVS